MAFPPWGSSDHVVVSVSIDFPSHSQQDVLFHRIVYDYSCADWDGLHVPWDYIFKLSASAAASEFCEWLQVGINVYIPHWKCQVKPHSSPWFSAAHAATIVHRNHFFVCTKRINLLNLRQSSNRLVIVAKGFLKQKSPSLSRNVAFRTFGELPIVLSRKVNLPYPPINDSEVLPSASDKAKLFAENFSKNSNLDDSVFLYLFPLLDLIWNCIFLELPTWLKCHNEPWFVKAIWSWSDSSGVSKELWAGTFLDISWTLQ